MIIFEGVARTQSSDVSVVMVVWAAQAQLDAGTGWTKCCKQWRQTLRGVLEQRQQMLQPVGLHATSGNGGCCDWWDDELWVTRAYAVNRTTCCEDCWTIINSEQISAQRINGYVLDLDLVKLVDRVIAIPIFYYTIYIVRCVLFCDLSGRYKVGYYTQYNPFRFSLF